MDFDVVIIGGGPGGYVCAIKAAQLGLKVAVIDKSKTELGGTCLTKGCIPTKTILQSAKVRHIIERSSEFGIDSSLISTNLDKIIDRSRSVIAGLNGGVNGLFSKNKIELIEGTASFKDKNTLTVEKDGQVREVTGKHVVIATGAKPRLIPGIDVSLIQDGLVWTSKEAISPKFLPEKLLIVGSGAIGIELASFYNFIGSDVTVVEIMDRILVQEDPEISEAAAKSFSKQGITIRVGTKSQNIERSGSKVSVDLVDKNENVSRETFDAVLLAIGVVPNTSGLTLDGVGINSKPNGTIETNEFNETSVPGVYAIGDVAEAPWLAHKASREGIRVAEKIAGVSDLTPINLSAIPSCTYSYPQIASIGLTEDKSKDLGRDIKVGRSYFRGNGKALAAGESNGFVKVIFDAVTGEILGAHMIGYEVTELLPVFSVAIAGELTEKELMSAVFPHPTMSECLQEAVYAAFGMSING